MEKYIVTYCVYDTYDFDLYQEVVGIYDTEEQAKNAMKESFLTDYTEDDYNEEGEVEWYNKTETELYFYTKTDTERTERYNIRKLNIK